MLKDEKITFRLPAEMKEQVEQVAERYNLTLSNATLFLLSCGMDVERSYRPVLFVANKVTGFCRRLEGGELDATESKPETN